MTMEFISRTTIQVSTLQNLLYKKFRRIFIFQKKYKYTRLRTTELSKTPKFQRNFPEDSWNIHGLTGDDYVDWVCLDAYSSDSTKYSFNDTIFTSAAPLYPYTRLTKLTNKPMMIAEFGAIGEISLNFPRSFYDSSDHHPSSHQQNSACELRKTFLGKFYCTKDTYFLTIIQDLPTMHNGSQTCQKHSTLSPKFEPWSFSIPGTTRWTPLSHLQR